MKLIRFIGLWVAGVASIAIVSLLLRSALGSWLRKEYHRVQETPPTRRRWLHAIAAATGGTRSGQ